ncbi:unnamed protein product [Gordionus sp. m RMFG-2023]
MEGHHSKDKAPANSCFKSIKCFISDHLTTLRELFFILLIYLLMRLFRSFVFSCPCGPEHVDIGTPRFRNLVVASIPGLRNRNTSDYYRGDYRNANNERYGGNVNDVRYGGNINDVRYGGNVVENVGSNVVGTVGAGNPYETYDSFTNSSGVYNYVVYRNPPRGSYPAGGERGPGAIRIKPLQVARPIRDLRPRYRLRPFKLSPVEYLKNRSHHWANRRLRRIYSLFFVLIPAICLFLLSEFMTN